MVKAMQMINAKLFTFSFMYLINNIIIYYYSSVGIKKPTIRSVGGG
ncbi:hypothetical protein CSC04_3744 [Enterobacter roggenkampii]|nr:hypothetical protein CSC04_3744 [Enterobacter roggenkampii]